MHLLVGQDGGEDDAPVDNTARFAFGLFMTVGMLVSYLPQIAKLLVVRSSTGISVWFLALGMAGCIATLANILIVQTPALACCSASWKLPVCIANTLGITQLATQFLCYATIFTLFFLFFPTHLRYSLPGSSSNTHQPLGFIASTAIPTPNETFIHPSDSYSPFAPGTGIPISDSTRRPHPSIASLHSNHTLPNTTTTTTTNGDCDAQDPSQTERSTATTNGTSHRHTASEHSQQHMQRSDGLLADLRALRKDPTQLDTEIQSDIHEEGNLLARDRLSASIRMPNEQGLDSSISMSTAQNHSFVAKALDRVKRIFKRGISTPQDNAERTVSSKRQHTRTWNQLLIIRNLVVLAGVISFSFVAGVMVYQWRVLFNSDFGRDINNQCNALDSTPNPGSPFRDTTLSSISSAFFGFIATACTMVQFLPQLLLTYQTQEVGALSIPTMIMQSPGSFMMVISLSLQPGADWTSWMTFFVAGTMQGMLLMMCLYFVARDATSSTSPTGNDQNTRSNGDTGDDHHAPLLVNVDGNNGGDDTVSISGEPATTTTTLQSTNAVNKKSEITSQRNDELAGNSAATLEEEEEGANASGRGRGEGEGRHKQVDMSAISAARWRRGQSTTEATKASRPALWSVFPEATVPEANDNVGESTEGGSDIQQETIPSRAMTESRVGAGGRVRKKDKPARRSAMDVF